MLKKVQIYNAYYEGKIRSQITAENVSNFINSIHIFDSRNHYTDKMIFIYIAVNSSVV